MKRQQHNENDDKLEHKKLKEELKIPETRRFLTDQRLKQQIGDANQTGTRERVFLESRADLVYLELLQLLAGWEHEENYEYEAEKF